MHPVRSFFHASAKTTLALSGASVRLCSLHFDVPHWHLSNNNTSTFIAVACSGTSVAKIVCSNSVVQANHRTMAEKRYIMLGDQGCHIAQYCKGILQTHHQQETKHSSYIIHRTQF